MTDTSNLVWPRFAQLTALGVVAVAGLLAGIVLAFVAAGELQDEYPDAVLVAILNTASNALLLVGVISGVGAVVLAGVRALHSSPELAVRVRRSQR